MCCSDWRACLPWWPRVSPISVFTRVIGDYSRCCFWFPTSRSLDTCVLPAKRSAVVYNLVHNYVLPLALGLLAWKQRSPLGGEIALIWLAHISFDRCLGYGLKFPGVFRYTHIQSSATLEHPAVLQ